MTEKSVEIIIYFCLFERMCGSVTIKSTLSSIMIYVTIGFSSPAVIIIIGASLSEPHTSRYYCAGYGM